MNKLPAFLFYPGDWLKDPSVSTLDYFEKGVYITLLCFAFQSGGKLLLGNDGCEPMNPEDVAKLLGLEQNKADKVLTSLVRHGCLKQDDSGCYYNSRMVRDAEILEIRRENGQKGGKMKAKNMANALQTSSELPSKPLANDVENAKQNSSLSYSSSSSLDIKNKNARAKAEIDGGALIEPPPGMPKNVEDAITMAGRVGVPEDFVRTRAYPQCLACGWMLDDKRPIRSFEAWSKMYYDNTLNAQKRKAQNGGIRRSQQEAQPYLYNPNLKPPEL